MRAWFLMEFVWCWVILQENATQNDSGDTCTSFLLMNITASTEFQTPGTVLFDPEAIPVAGGGAEPNSSML